MSSDTIVLLILIVLIIGVIATLNEKNTQVISSKITDENLEKRAIELCDNLINNPGTPKNWHKLANKNNVVPGLAIVDENNNTVVNSVDYEKLIAYDKVIENNIKISLKPLTGTVEEITIGNNNLDSYITVNRLVICDFLKKYSIGSFKEDGESSSNHFKVFISNLKKTDYYLLFDENSYKDYFWSIESTQVPGIKKQATSDKIYLNNLINEKIILKSDGIIFIDINHKNPKAVVVGVPKDFDKNKLNYDYFVSKECNFKVQI